MTDDAEAVFEQLELKEYETTALKHILTLGRTTAPNLAEATGIPKARIYGILDTLADRGFIKIIPGRPKEYQPKPPATILDQAKTNRQQEYEKFCADLEAVRDPFIDRFQPLYEQASDDITPADELFYVVSVGEPSERETKSLYREAADSVYVITKSFEYFDAVEPAIQDALDQDVSIQALFLHPRHLSATNQEIQSTVIDYVTDKYPEIAIRFSTELLPWRGTLIDPSMDYETGQAIVLVEEKDVPLHMRQAAVTENGSFVAGLHRYFDLIWEYDSVEKIE
ncbi:TrmB family transcriptional regulator [Natrinema hispanicum]|uniref:Sugar-specific transcriptional regulator TrmB n=1 Tax=Natrinema hispanicum TaxID=392421 RepID=A0A1G6WUH7_9EURY|nr:helix-turn-helix domain-containing protein [Natrinema hispanicum]SDD69464.1 Sugar-specific transcriptional regulator TrmB [Natrinema hispanicum]